MKIIPILILTIFLHGCALFKNKEEPAIDVKTEVAIDSEVLTLCERLPEKLVLDKFSDFTALHGKLVNQYITCANRHYDAVELLKKFGGISGTDKKSP